MSRKVQAPPTGGVFSCLTRKGKETPLPYPTEGRGRERTKEGEGRGASKEGEGRERERRTGEGGAKGNETQQQFLIFGGPYDIS